MINKALGKMALAWRLGIVYQHEFDMDYSGGANVEPPGVDVGIITELLLATMVRAGFTQEMSDDLTAHLSIGWEDWSDMDNINLSTRKTVPPICP